jgi:hypothetical protein
MSNKPSHSTEHMAPPEAQQDSVIPAGKIIAVGISALLIFVASGYWSYTIYDKRSRELQPLGPDPIPRQIGQREIGIVDQVPFDVYRSLQTYRQNSKKRLNSWGWIDKKQGTVHMPIEQAMEQLIQEPKK